jgi:hypothetical protein
MVDQLNEDKAELLECQRPFMPIETDRGSINTYLTIRNSVFEVLGGGMVLNLAQSFLGTCRHYVNWARER